MGKMLDAFQQARLRRGVVAPAVPTLTTIWPDEEAMVGPPPDEDEEMPFIEVGGPREPGEKVLPVLSAPLLVVETPEPAPLPPAALDGLMTVRFQPLSLEGMPTGPVSRFAPELIAYHQ